MDATSFRQLARRRAPKPPPEPVGAPRAEVPRFAWPVLLLGLLGGVLLWAALPPANLSLLVWIAPVPWLWLVQRPRWTGRRPYLALWIAGSVHWLAVLQGIRLPYWALYFGWAALSLYLAVYLPLFVVLTRVAVHRWRWPLWIAAPIVWTGLELARGHLLTGFSGALLGHALVAWLPLIQIADLGGAYAVSFLVMLVASALVAAITITRGPRQAWTSLAAASIALTAVIVYGYARMHPVVSASTTAKPVHVAMLQGTYDTIFEYNPRRNLDMFEQYLELAQQASRQHPELQLLLWPESTFTENNPYWIADGELPVPRRHADLSPTEYRRLAAERAASFREKAEYVAHSVNQRSGAPLWQMVGVETVDLRQDPALRYNSALLLTPEGQPAGRYDKIHLVMFGEYLPLGRWMPWIYEWSPITTGTTVGSGPRAFELGGLRFAPSVCFESFVPHFVRWQLVTLERQGTPADVLVNLTHDGWFWGSSILDLHRTCAIFRAVEHRKPMLTAANPGLTAWIDGDGRVRQALPRHQADYLVAEVQRDPRGSVYRRFGDLPAALCLALTLALGVALVRSRSSGPAPPRPT